MRTFISFLALGCLVSLVSAQQVGGVGDVPVSFSGVVVWGPTSVPSSGSDATVTMSCDALAATQPLANRQVTVIRGPSLPSTSTTDRLTTRFIPGVTYTVLLTVDNHFDPSTSAPHMGAQGVGLSVAVPTGYAIEMLNPTSNQIHFAERNYGTASFDNNAQNSQIILKVRLRSQTGVPGLRAGLATSLDTDAVLWQLSLGELANGVPAGCISFNNLVGTTSLAGMFTRAKLACDGSSSSILLLGDSADRNVYRQILAPQVCIDITGQLTSGAIRLRCYHPSQRSADVEPDGYFAFTGSPFADYTVTPGASDADGIAVTCVYSNVGPAPTFTGTVARMLATKLTRTGASPAYTWTAEQWHGSSQATLATEVRARSGNTETFTLSDNSSNVAFRTTRTYAAMLLGEEVTEETVGTTNSITTYFSFYTDDPQSPSYGKLKIASNNSGGWEGIIYNSAGRVSNSYGPFNNTPATVPTNLPETSGVATSITYSPDPFGANSRPATVATQAGGITTAQSATSYTDETPFSAYSSHPLLTVVNATRTDNASTSATLTSVTKFFAEDVGVVDDTDHPPAVATDDFFRGQVHSIQRPDKVKQSFVYQRGTTSGTTFTPSGNAGLDSTIPNPNDPDYPLPAAASRITVITGSSDSAAGSAYSRTDGYPADTVYLVNAKSTMEVTIRDAHADVVRTETHAWVAGTWNLVSWVDYSYNLAHEPILRTSSNGAVWSANWSGERKTDETDEAGIRLDYTYDAADRIDTVTRAAGGAISALATRFSYDAVGRVTGETVGYGLSETLVSARVYDTAGRLTSESSPGPNGAITTGYSYNPGARQVTVTLPNGGTRVETTQADGRLQQVTGTGSVPQYYTYAIETGGLSHARVNVGSSGSSRLQETWTDWLGRTTKTSRPGFTGQSAFEEQATYDGTTGRLTKTTRTGLAKTLYEYDALSQPKRSGLGFGTSDVLDPDGIDRIADADQSFEQISSAWWLTKVAKTYPNTGTSAGDPLTVSTTRQRLTGFSGNVQAETVTTDVDGNTVTRSVAVNRSSKTTTVTTTSSVVSNSQAETYVNGLPTSITRFDGLTYTIGHDALGRKSTSTDPRTGTIITYYKPGSAFVSGIEGAVDAAGTLGWLEQYDYDSAGRVTGVTNAGGKVTRTAYNPLDQIVRQWGDATYPVEYGYNDLGERVTMKTYRAGSGWNGTTWPASPGTADWTRWEFDAPSGLLKEKYDAANLNATTGQPITGAKKISYTYNSRGQTATRTWARGVVTTYGYDANTGELLTQTYSGGPATPGVTYTYTRAGQVATVADVTGTRTFDYGAATGSHALQLDTISLDAFYGSRVLTRWYDSAKRPAGFRLGPTGNLSGDLVQTHVFHSTTGRFESLSTLSPQLSATPTTFTYGYLTNSALLSTLGVSGTSFTVTRTYETSRDLLTAIDAKWSTASRTRYDYTYNALGQRVTAKQSGDVFADFGGSTYYRYHYNDRGELDDTADYLGEDPASTSSPQLSGRHFAYNYDNLGNRTSASRTGTAGTPDTYTPNSLNQYLSRTNPYAHTAGTACSDSTIVVTGGTGTSGIGRQGRYWDAQVTLNNTSAPAKADLTVTASNSTLNLVRTEIRTAYLPPAEQVFTYDDDGNLTGDGVWSYTYDAENRLITMTATAAAKNAGYADRLLEFKYDYLGRRVQKRSAIISANGGFTPGSTWTRYLYDGWSLVAEFDAPSGTSCGTLLRSYTWGLDLAGSLTATGGVGALVQITQHTGTAASYLPTYDGNGNVASLLRASDGTIAARYEYSPFGELLRAEGSYALSNPFRFSTKFTDDESGLVYYGARYYSPSLGRFINRDPIAEQGGLNLYSFCGNDGINHWDYLGQSWLSKAFRSIGKFFKKYWKPIVAVVAGVVTGGAAIAAMYGTSLGAGIGALLTGQLAITAPLVTGATVVGTTTISVGIGAGNLMIGAGVAGFTSGVVGAKLNGASWGQALKAGAIGGVISAATAYLGQQIAKGYNSWKNGKVDGYFNNVYDPATGQYLTPEALDPSLIAGKQNIYVNGMMNSLEDAARNGQAFEQGKSFILAYNRTDGFLADLVEAGLGKLTGTSGVGRSLAKVLSQIDPSGSTLFMHSQGAQIGINALSELSRKGIMMPGLTVGGYGGATNVLTSQAITKSVGAQWGSWVINAFDAVPNIAGLNAIFAPHRAVTSLLASPLLFFGPKTSPHSSMSGSGGTFWSNFNTAY